jgi:YVTN family beta-propeller protein
VTFSKDGQFAYITSIKDNSVSVIDREGQTVVKTIPFGEGPNGIAYFAGNSWRRSTGAALLSEAAPAQAG